MGCTMAAEAGKGDAPRKAQDQVAYTQNYSKIFGHNSWLERKKKEEQEAKDRESALQMLVDESQRLGLYD